MSNPITPKLLLHAYGTGVFPMSESRYSSEIFWVDPRQRGIMPLNGFHVSRSLRRKIRKAPFEIRLDSDFEGVLGACADRPQTWINEEIYGLYLSLNHLGWAHSLETWQDGELVGGVYGVSMGTAFFGESMFSHARDASKVALAYLVARLIVGGYTLFDTQFTTSHLRSLGAIDIPRDEYHERLKAAQKRDADFFRQSVDVSPSEVLQLITQTS